MSSQRYDQAVPWHGCRLFLGRPTAATASDRSHNRRDSNDKESPGYRNYTTDGHYWTVRKQGDVYWVVKIDFSSGFYVWSEIWGGYQVAGAVAQLSYLQGKKDAAEQVRASRHEALDTVGLGASTPRPTPLSSDSAPLTPGGSEKAVSDDEDG